MRSQTHGGRTILSTLESIRDALRAYSFSTGVNAFLIDDEGNRVAQASPRPAAQEFCAHCAGTRAAACNRVWLYGSYQAERFGGKYVFFCPSGMTYWSAPLRRGADGQGALLGGPVMMVEPDEFMLDELLADTGIDDGTVPALKEKAKDIPVVSPETVRALSDLLGLLALQLSEPSQDPYEESRRDAEQQADISATVHQLKDRYYAEAVSPVYPMAKERELMRLITIGDRANAQKVLNELLGFTFFSSGRDLETVRSRMLELLVLLSRAAVEGGADVDEIFGLNHHYLDDIFKLKTIEQLTAWLSRILARFTDCVFNLADIRHRDIIYQSMNYVRTHYAGRISLEEVAAHVHLNPSYLSRIFKDEVKCNFVSYVNKVRVETAKKLLLDKDIPLPEVAGMVGFDEQSYFTKVFKKLTDVTPGKYRESMGRG